jgi:hypothetical protein
MLKLKLRKMCFEVYELSDQQNLIKYVDDFIKS